MMAERQPWAVLERGRRAGFRGAKSPERDGILRVFFS